jgi:hypothetical protein
LVRQTRSEKEARVLTGEHADLVGEAVAALCHEIMEAGVDAQIGAGFAERAPAERATHRNDHRPRRPDIRAGSFGAVQPEAASMALFPPEPSSRCPLRVGSGS